MVGDELVHDDHFAFLTGHGFRLHIREDGRIDLGTGDVRQVPILVDMGNQLHAAHLLCGRPDRTPAGQDGVCICVLGVHA